MMHSLLAASQASHTFPAHRLWRLLVGPSRSITEPEARRQAQLLASLMLGLVASGLSIVIVRATWVDPTYIIYPVVLIGLGGLALLYTLSRGRHYRAAAW